MIVQFEKLVEHAKMPMQATTGAAGYDLYSSEDVTLEVGKIRLVSSGLRLHHMTPGYALFICSRSGWASKGVFCMNAPGIVDSDFTGDMKIILGNFGEDIHTIVKGERVAQLVPFQLVNDYAQWDVTGGLIKPVYQNPVKREGGFGSTGTR